MDVRVVRFLGIAGLGAFLASCGGSPTTPANNAAISLATTTVSFGAQVGSGNPTAQTVNVTNSGTGTLSGLTVGTIAYGAGASGWLRLALLLRADKLLRHRLAHQIGRQQPLSEDEVVELLLVEFCA